MTKNEAAVQNDIRLAASELNIMLFRNNVGVCEDITGRIIRYGLANDSAQMNRRIKSSDLIGVLLDGRFLAVECKREGWKFKKSDTRAVAQKAFIDVIRQRCGVAGFVTSVYDFIELIRQGTNRHG